MSRYRKVEVQTWGDKKFQALSPMPPSGQGLWLYLLTGPRTSLLPGLLAAGRAAMAEELGWSQEAFDEAFAEAFDQGMVKADWKARLVWLPNALRESNKPENPNVAIAWRREFDLLPDCALKSEAQAAIVAFLTAVGPKYLAGFIGDPAAGADSVKSMAKPLPKPSEKALPEPSPKGLAIQEQEQEQKEQTLSPRDEPRPRVATLIPRRRLDAAWEWERGYVLQRQHQEFCRRLGGDLAAAEQRLFAFYAAAVKDWPAEVPVPDAFAFWNPRFEAAFVVPVESHAATKTVPVRQANRAGTWDGSRTWRCHHGAEGCTSRTSCELRTAREVGQGLVRLEDVPSPIRRAVEAMAGAYAPQAVEA